MAQSWPLQLYRVYNDHRSISAVARTITLSFSQDPLIRWLRPKATPWGEGQHEVHRWQERRIQRAVLEGMVFQSAPTAQLAQLFPPKSLSTKLPAVCDVETNNRTDAGSVVLLFPPVGRMKWTFRRIILALKLWLKDRFSPASEKGTDEGRLEIMMGAHDDAIGKIKAQHHDKNVWYLEVVAVHPSLQSRGLGAKVMEWVLDYIKHEAIVLECTAESNLKFYERFGFRVVEELSLEDENGAVKCWMMLREGTQKE